jgi:hypothetical protein
MLSGCGMVETAVAGLAAAAAAGAFGWGIARRSAAILA